MSKEKINNMIDNIMDKDNIGAEFDSETKLLYAFQTVVEWLEENKNE